MFFIVCMIPAAFHYSDVSLHAVNQTIWENGTSKSFTDTPVFLQRGFQ